MTSIPRRKVRRRSTCIAAGLVVAGLLASCGDDSTSDSTADPAPAATGGDTTPPAGGGEGIVLAVNPWTGSAVNANVAKVILEAQLGTAVTLLDIDENATWVGMDAGDIDAVLEVWPSGHAADYDTYVTTKKSVVDIGLLGPSAKIGWYVPTFVVDEHPELATWEGFKDPALAGLFATAESGDLGQFLMGDPSYVTYDEQIIANLELPLKYVVAGSEASLLTAIDQAVADNKPVLMQFWKPHWKQLEVALTEVTLPAVTDECIASAGVADGGYACDYPVDELYKAASAGLQAKNAAAFAFLSKFQLTTEQQSEIAGYVDRDGMTALDAAKKWVDANADIVATWLS
ncbi:MAG: glycine betaine/proline transport system substrate-binding protein [Acidimicrobiaceae bacterium]|nr:MAG: glycine betaine/proline transport system substrate-binding protein [Acidimicrobiaceae bacterium]